MVGLNNHTQAGGVPKISKEGHSSGEVNQVCDQPIRAYTAESILINDLLDFFLITLKNVGVVSLWITHSWQELSVSISDTPPPPVFRRC